MDQWSSHSIRQLLLLTHKSRRHPVLSLKHNINIIQHYHCHATTLRNQNKAVFLGKNAAVVLHGTCYLFTLSHPLLGPLSTTCEQMVHSRHRVIESLRRRCNCFSNYALTTTEQWESTLPQLYTENPERGRSLRGVNWTRWRTSTRVTSDWQPDNNAHSSCCLFSASPLIVGPGRTSSQHSQTAGWRRQLPSSPANSDWTNLSREASHLAPSGVSCESLIPNALY